MRNRAPALVAVVAFAVAVAAMAVLAGGGGDSRLVKLPVASLGGAGAAEDAAGVASSRSALLYPGSVEYRVEGTLADLPATAPGYRLGSAASTEAVQHLAEALGLRGEVRADGSGWVVRAADRELRVERYSGLPWYLGPACADQPVSSEGGRSVVPCSAEAVASPVGGGSSSGGVGECPPEARCVVPDSAIIGAPTCPAGSGACRMAGEATAPAPTCVAGRGACRMAGVATVPACPDARSDAGCAVPAPIPAPTPACPADAGCPTTAPALAPACPAGAECPVPTPVSMCKGATVDCLPPHPSSCPPDVPCIPHAPVVEPPRPADLPSEEEARRLAEEAFARLGVDTEGLVVEDGWLTWQARVETTVDGLPVIGLGTSLSIGPKGEIVGANGFLAVPDRIGDYPLVGVDAGLRRLTSGFGSGFGPGPRPLVARDTGVEAKDAIEPAIAACDDPAVTCTAPPEGPEPAPLVQVVTGVHLALLQTGDVLVPAYAFELAAGGTVPVPAVTDQWLDQKATTTVED